MSSTTTTPAVLAPHPSPRWPIGAARRCAASRGLQRFPRGRHQPQRWRDSRARLRPAGLGALPAPETAPTCGATCRPARGRRIRGGSSRPWGSSTGTSRPTRRSDSRPSRSSRGRSRTRSPTSGRSPCCVGLPAPRSGARTTSRRTSWPDGSVPSRRRRGARSWTEAGRPGRRASGPSARRSAAARGPRASPLPERANHQQGPHRAPECETGGRCLEPTATGEPASCISPSRPAAAALGSSPSTIRNWNAASTASA